MLHAIRRRGIIIVAAVAVPVVVVGVAPVVDVPAVAVLALAMLVVAFLLFVALQLGPVPLLSGLAVAVTYLTSASYELLLIVTLIIRLFFTGYLPLRLRVGAQTYLTSADTGDIGGPHSGTKQSNDRRILRRGHPPARPRRGLPARRRARRPDRQLSLRALVRIGLGLGLANPDPDPLTP
eukprot:scaffold3864_cov59-Phaeocystis_antarctica.AAC.6